MEPRSRHILVVGDQSVDPTPFLVHALVKKPTPLLQAFLRDVQPLLRREIEGLPHGTRSLIPAFASLHELVEQYQRQGVHLASLDSALTCLAQFTHFIGVCEENPRAYLQPGILIIGTCTGLLAASAIASSDSLVALIPLAVETVRLAFRLGATAARKAESLETSQTPWTSLVTGVDSATVSVAVEEFNQTQGLRSSHQVYVSSVATNSVAVSGPPSLRARLFEASPLLQGVHHRTLPIHAPYHAPHLFAAEYDILDAASIDILNRYHQIHTVCGLNASSTRSTSALFTECIDRILRECMDWNQLVTTSLNFLAPLNAPSYRILSLGPTPLGNALASALKHEQPAGLKLTLEDHASWLAANSVPTYLSSSPAGCNIAIIGMAGRFPDAADHEAFWELLAQGLDVHRKVPPDRFDVDAHTDPSGNGKNKSHTPYGCFIEEPGKFDPRFFNMSPREAKQTDPMQRLAITTAYEAMESSGFVLNRTPTTHAHRVGTFYGQTSDDWREINAAENIDTYFITGGVRAFGPGRMNYHFGFSGPSFSLDTACSSSFAAIQLACTSLRAGDCDTVFAGGMNVLTNPDIFAGLSKGQFLSKTGSCKTYDNAADGYCRGDGVVTVILKRVEDALRENDPILGIIRGTATNHSAEAVSITHPHAGAQTYLFQKIMSDIGVDPREVDYVEMHGTGTQAGDGIEIQSVTNVFAPPGPHQRGPRHQPLYIGSAKANIGHGEAVSGVSALVKVLLMFQKNLIPPHCGIKGVINQGFPSDLQARGVQIASRLTPFPKPAKGGRRRMVFVNNFSAAGGNSAMLVEDAPERPVVAVDTSKVVSTAVVAVSAKSLASFGNNARSLLAWIEQNPDVQLADLAYTTTARRNHYTYRVVFAVDSVAQLRQKLQTYVDRNPSPRALSLSRPPAVAFVFTGQGAQYAGMGQALFAGCIPFRSQLQQLDELATAQGFPTFLGVIDGSQAGDLAAQSPVVTQLASTALQMALADLWKSWGAVPAAVLGHSLGEYAALYVAGVLSAMDALFLVGRRAQLLEAACVAHSHGMLAVQGAIPAAELLRLVVDNDNDAAIGVACLNSKTETVLAGPVEAIARAKETLAAARPDLRCITLKVPFAFHSAQVDPILDALAQAAEPIVFHSPRIPILSPVSASVIDRAGIVGPAYLTRHAREPVNFVGALHTAATQGVISPQTVWLELGPHPICSSMVQSALGPDSVVCAALQRKESGWKTTATALSTLYQTGVPVDWNEVHAGLEQTKGVQVLRLPTYSFDEKTYWLDYTNNWTLTKGERLPASSETVPAAPEPQRFSTTSIQRIVSETVRPDGGVEVVAEADLHEPKLKAVISGHRVGGAPLCPSSLNADMAFTLAKYAFQLGQAPEGRVEAEPHMNICKMESSAPLILDLQRASQTLTIRGVFDPVHRRCQVSFHTGTQQHAQCEVRFEDAAQWAAEFQRHAFLVQSRIDSLQQRDRPGTHSLYRGMAYKLFTALVDYSPTFQGMEQVALDSANLEATARVRLQTTPQDGEFLVSPYHTDSVAHISGFVMNATDAIDSAAQIYISHGWESMRFVRRLEVGREYRSYVKMSPVSEGSKMVSGDVYVLEGQEIIGVVGGLRFQCVPRKLMLTLLGIKGSPSGGAPQLGSAKVAVAAAAVSSVVRKEPSAPIQRRSSPSKPAPQLPSLPAPSASTLPRALDIIAAEVGCAVSELGDNIPFADLGVDSLMSLSITARFREELEINLGNSIFQELSTVGELKAHLADSSTAPTPPLTDFPSDKESSTEGELTKVHTPVESDDEAGVLVLSDSEDDDTLSRTGMIIRATIAEELGVELSEVGDTVDLSQMGLDSLMSLAILGSLREKTGLTFSPDFLIEHPTVEGMLGALGLSPSPVAKPVPEPAPASTNPTSPKSLPPAPIILLSGNPKTATRRLFLLPDGSGAAFSYATIPALDATTAVYAMNSPFMRDPHNFTVSVPDVTTQYLHAIKSRQPSGPYLLGGWSAGGVMAYELTRQLLARGEVVEKLVLIDSPFPVGLEALPPVFHEFCNRIGLLGDGQTKTPEWLLPHFRATVTQLTAYSEELARKMPVDVRGMPATTVIWARDGVVKNSGDPEPQWEKGVRMPNSMAWLCGNRLDLGENGWETLVGRGKVRCVSMEGNHFTMMREPLAAEVGRLVKEALDV
ncbi:putative polyketide synthase [Aspergillus aculeatinus CBS 121060]|uniref:Polyketide synthase n=1 Tax=Aspergillus aculeatinus CBS 121060 TaxID=1448322 RepID=A0ACD1H7B9_9EURO|nr:putative polyketide synthase [Aspergillus aculeatinus CBS 121060]RAH69481.1 putative polyketide synthase [Aspergillus aculeatinus CBS 121060]